MNAEEIRQQYSGPAWHQYLNGWLRAHLLKTFENEKWSPEEIQQLRESYETEAARDPNFALALFIEWYVKEGKGQDPEDILDAAESVADENIFLDASAPPVMGFLEAFHLWQNASTTADVVRAAENVAATDLRSFDPSTGGKVLPPDFLQALIDYGSPEVSRMAGRYLAHAPSGKELTMRPAQAVKFLRTQGVTIDHLSVTGTLLDVIMPNIDTMWELDFSTKKARFGSVDGGHFKPLKSFKLSDGFIHTLAAFWKKHR